MRAARPAHLVLAALLAVSCGRTGEVQGTLTSADDGNPIAQTEVVAAASAACARLTAVTDASGRFVITGLCAGERYTLRTGDPAWWVTEPLNVTAADAETGADLRAHRLPATDGVWLRHGRELTRVEEPTRLDRLAVGGEIVTVPVALPAAPPQVRGDDRLVLVGEAAPGATLHRLTPLPEGAGSSWYTLGRPEAPTGTTELSDPPRLALVLTADALPAGWYALRPDGRSEAWIVTFGDAGQP